MLVLVVLMDYVLGGFTFIPMPIVFPVEVPVVNIVHVVSMRNSNMAAAGPVLVGVVFMSLACHDVILPTNEHIFH